MFWHLNCVFHLNCVLMLNWIVWKGTVFNIETVLPLNWIVLKRTVWLNTLAWKRFFFIIKLFEIELFMFIKMNFVLNTLQRLICHKPQRKKERKKQTNKQVSSLFKIGDLTRYNAFAVILTCVIQSTKRTFGKEKLSNNYGYRSGSLALVFKRFTTRNFLILKLLLTCGNNT